MTNSISAVAAVLAMGLAASGVAADKLQGSASVKGQVVNLAHGFGIWDGKDRPGMSIGFFTEALNPADEGMALKQGFFRGLPPPAKIPRVTLDLGFEKGSARAASARLTSCNVSIHWYKFESLNTSCGGSLPDDLPENPASVGVLELSGDLRPGGVVQGKIKGEDGSGAEAWKWELAFTTTLRAP